jgi:phage shock protein E
MGSFFTQPEYTDRVKLFQLAPLDQVAEALKNPETIVIDTRSDAEVASGRVHHVNWNQCSGTPMDNEILSTKPESVVPDKNATIVLYCGTGRRAHKAKEILVSQGYTGTILNAGGYNDLNMAHIVE